jgi:hypothetical protein
MEEIDILKDDASEGERRRQVSSKLSHGNKFHTLCVNKLDMLLLIPP